jgi:hypothetical protein
MLKIPHCLDNLLIDGGKVVSPTLRPHFTPQKHEFFLMFPVLISVRGPQGLVRPEGLGKLKFHLIRSRTRDLLACSFIYIYLYSITNFKNPGQFPLVTHIATDNLPFDCV